MEYDDTILGIRIRIIASRARRGRMRSLATCFTSTIAKCEFASVELRIPEINMSITLTVRLHM